MRTAAFRLLVVVARAYLCYSNSEKYRFRYKLCGYETNERKKYEENVKNQRWRSLKKIKKAIFYTSIWREKEKHLAHIQSPNYIYMHTIQLYIYNDKCWKHGDGLIAKSIKKRKSFISFFNAFLALFQFCSKHWKGAWLVEYT